jgi:exodeoxyribonuclease VII small subunit
LGADVDQILANPGGNGLETSPNADQNDSFENSMSKLEMIVKKLEQGDATLDGMLAMFEEGVDLARKCNNLLDSAEQKVNILVKNPENNEVEEKSFIESDESV